MPTAKKQIQLVLLYEQDDDAMALKEFLQTLDEGQIIEASQENLHDEDGSYWETRIVTVKSMIPLRRVTQKKTGLC